MYVGSTRSCAKYLGMRTITSSHLTFLFESHFQAKLQFIKDHHEQRMTRLEQMIEERRRMTEDHESGRRLLSNEEYERASRQYQNFQRKLEHMQKRSEEVRLCDNRVVSLPITIYVN